MPVASGCTKTFPTTSLRAAALRYPDLADLPAAARGLLVRGGYTTREAIAQASDADLLLLKGLNSARLRAVRAVIPRAE